MIDLDFETRSKIDIKMGPWRYAQDASTRILCLSIKMFDSKSTIWLPGDPMPGWVLFKHWEIYGEGSVRAHNAMFEKAVWREILVKKFGWPDIPDKYWKCSSAKAAAHSLPRDLDRACIIMKTAVKKDQDGKRIMLKLAKPRKITKKNPKEWHEKEDCPEDFEKLYAYCANDTEAEAALDNSLRDLSPSERRLWLLDQKINARGVYMDVKAVKGAIKIIEDYELGCNIKLAEISDNRFWSVTQLMQIKEWMEEKGFPATSLDKTAVDNFLADKNLPDDIREVLKIRQSLGKTSTKKLHAMLGAICEDGRVKDLLMFHGANTGRWSGKNIQIQNFPRVKVKDLEEKMAALRTGKISAISKYGDVMHVISSCLRGMIIAEPGNHFFVADYAAIEARGVCWLAGQENTLQLFRDKKDVYRKMASVIYSKHIDKVDGGEKDGPERQLGKQAVLGCGYQMGAPKFKLTCEGYKMQVDDALAERAVEAYRSTNDKVVDMWWAQEKAAKRAILKRKIVDCGKIRWGMSGKFLYCRLPSGRCLAYPFPSVKMGKTPWGEERLQICYWGVNVKNQWVEIRSYGGKLVENITQAVCRDIMAEAMLRLDAAGYEVLFTVHDEIVCETPEDFGSLEEFLAILTEVPKWAQGFPINADGWNEKRYRK